ncbi:hypothetical protein NVIE_003090 [Nitrososphaera viennensis EN76]|uniref:Uncharacterized protein n=1 Tax=Nitrososphaera viennensis EN76 TaxID=926571 RepID=A0A060HFY9_9ARCH|nr:hypothetical protein NVIE_003090 [Nitrososphaera viennensis EN76]
MRYYHSFFGISLSEGLKPTVAEPSKREGEADSWDIDMLSICIIKREAGASHPFKLV